ncbi:MAG: hypothetical protein FWD69_03735 [Polyangiaceae bacterium]|nr:hypothetical protein [Polyangiaceae bacterium]
MSGRSFAYGLGFGVALGGAAALTLITWNRRSRTLAAKSSVGSGPFIDKVDMETREWTLCEESNSREHELENERNDARGDSQRW